MWQFLPALIGGIGSALTGGAKGAEQDRMTQAEYQLGRDALGQRSADSYESALQGRADIDLARRQQTMASGNNAFQNAMRSALALSHQPAQRPAGVPTISFLGGGIGAMGKQAAEAMQREAMVRLLEGEKFDNLPELRPYQLNSPAQMKGAGTFEKIMGMLGLGGTAAGAILGKQSENTHEHL